MCMCAAVREVQPGFNPCDLSLERLWVTAAINRRSLAESPSHLRRSQVKRLSTAPPVARDGRLFGSPQSPWWPFYSSGEWLLAPCWASACDAATRHKSLPGENNETVCNDTTQTSPNHILISCHMEKHLRKINTCFLTLILFLNYEKNS